MVIVKHVNSSFIGTDLEKILDERSIEALVITGATTNHCVETTTRMAGNLGYATYLVSDATWTFDRAGVDGKMIAAADIHYMSLSNLQEEFASVITADAVLAAMA
jgi:nicotinamidase-related amidase